jgi:ubiquinone/menaquinone biosynthesis C-methylase UbiE
MADSSQHARVRERFTRTAEQFARFSLTSRAAEAAFLVSLAAPAGHECVLDLACGPGTFTCAFAPRVRFIHGLDLTPALLAQARVAAAQLARPNASFTCGNAAALPFGAATFDLVVCAYAVHHFDAPLACFSEITRVLKPGGRLALVDIIVPDEADPEINNAIERARDASHVTTLTRSQFTALFSTAGLQVQECRIATRERSFDDWMQIAGWSRADAAYQETRRRMEATIADDAARFSPLLPEGTGDLLFVQTSFFCIGQKEG